jgi:hypothetical protein
MKQRLQSAFAELQTVSARTSKVLEGFSSTSEHLSSKRSSTLLGSLGGLLGLGSAYAISAFTTASLPALGVILTGLGIVGAMLINRGRRRMLLEAQIEANRLAADEILDRIKCLPNNVPTIVEDELWLEYTGLLPVRSILALGRPLRADMSRTIVRHCCFFHL